MAWLDPWWSTERKDEHFQRTFREQLARELSPGHCLFELPVKIIARGNGDDALFELLDGSGRVADVHLTWGQHQQRLPYPATAIYPSLEDWMSQVMLPQHHEWNGGAADD